MLRPRQSGESETDMIEVGRGFARNAGSLGAGAGKIQMEVNQAPLKIYDDANGDARFQLVEQDLTSTSPPSDTDVFAMHDGTGTLPKCLCRSDGSNWVPQQTVQFSYTGDGTTGRTIASSFQFEEVKIEEAGGTAVDGYAGSLSNGAMSGNSFSGGFTVETSGGITVGDNSGDAEIRTLRPTKS